MQEEIWKTIKENENYEVSNLGNVRRNEHFRVCKNGAVYRVKSINCKHIVCSTGLVFVSIGGKSTSLSKLVAKYFMNGYDERKFVFHKNKNKLDNRVENLTQRNEKFVFEEEDISERDYIMKYYEITKDGIIKRKCDNRVLHLSKDKKGYSIIRLKSPKFSKHKDKRKPYKVHRLVAMIYLPNYSDSLQVNHKNGIKSDNRVENLEMVTNSENALHAWRELDSTNRRRMLSENNRKDKVKFRKMIAASIKSNSKKVSMINCSGEVINTFDSMTAAAKFVGTTSVSGISYAAKHKTKRHGYFWKFI